MSNFTSMQIKRGLKASLPKSAPLGEPLFCVDTKELFVGTGSGVELVASRHSMIDGGEFGDSGEENVIADGGTF